MKNFGRNFLIAFLMILAIYQTTELWFEEFSSHNFFSFISAGTSGETQLYGMDKLIVNLGDSVVAARKESVMDTAYRREFDKLIASVVNKGERSSDTIDWTQLLNNRCVVYDFSSPVLAADFKKVLGIGSKLLNDFTDINLVVLLPNTTEDLVQVYIANDEQTACYKLKRTDLAQKGIDAISSFSANSSDMGYISSSANGFNIFRRNTFIPSASKPLKTINVVNPVLNGDKIDTKVLENTVNGFFDNPAVKWSSVIDNAYVFSDENNVVKYNLNGVLEYSGYNTAADDGSQQNILQNFVTAVDFLKKDNGIKNDVSLTKITIKQDKTVFWFDYAVNSASTALSEELKSGLGLNAAIEISVSRGNVIRYRRYVCVLENSGKTQTLNTDFVSAIDNVYNVLDNPNSLVDGIDLVYTINGRQENVPLNWLIRIGGKNYREAA